MATETTQEMANRARNDRIVFLEGVNTKLLVALRDILPLTYMEHDTTCPSGVGTEQYDPSRCNGCAHSRARAAIAAATT